MITGRQAVQEPGCQDVIAHVSSDLMQWLFERQDDLLIVLQPPTQPLHLERKTESE